MSNVIDEDLQQRVDAVADARGVPVATVLREALTTFLDREEARAALARDARAALAAYEAEGLHITGEEMSDWLRTWGTDGEGEAPECHG